MRIILVLWYHTCRLKANKMAMSDFLFIIVVLFSATEWTKTVTSASQAVSINWYFVSFPCFPNESQAEFSNSGLLPTLETKLSLESFSRLDCLMEATRRQETSSASLIVASYRKLSDPSSWGCHTMEPVSVMNEDNIIDDITEETCTINHPTATSCATFEGPGKSMVIALTPRSDQLATLAFCDLDTDGGGWTVIQRRQDGSLDFYRKWEDYKHGFGNIFGEFWFGLENVRRLVTMRPHELRVDMVTATTRERILAVYSSFSIAGEEDSYRLQVGGYAGNAGDSFSAHNGAKFATLNMSGSLKMYRCVTEYSCGFWFTDDCLTVNPNGKYERVFWKASNDGTQTPLIFIEMKIRPVSLATRKMFKGSVFNSLA